MSVFFEQAKRILNEVTIDEPAVKEARELLNSISKTAGLSDLVHDPKFQNIINLLTPFLVNYKVNQVVRLLEELAKENNKAPTFDPDTGVRKYI